MFAGNLDPKVHPGVDFFTYANGGWLARHPIPDSETLWGVGNLVTEELYVKLRTINENAVKAHAAAGTDMRKIGDFWETALDEAKADVLGLAPLRKELGLIDSIKTLDDVLDVSFALRPLQGGGLFSVTVRQDEKRSELMSVHIEQDGLALPDRDFYINTEQEMVRIRKEYVAHLIRMLKMLDCPEDDAASAAEAVMKFETALATASRKKEDLYVPEDNYHSMTPAALTEGHTPLIDWDRRLAAMSLESDTVIVGQPEFFTALNQLLMETPVTVLKDYLRLHLVTGYAEFLGKDWDAEVFAFYNKMLTGEKEPRHRWRRVLDTQDAVMGMLLGKVFVEKYFPEKTMKRYSNLVEAIRNSYRERIDKLDWMSEATKASAREKLDKLTVKIGYPTHWKDYADLVVGTDSYCGNMMNFSRWDFNCMIAKLGKPVDRSEWGMTPQTFNAYYEPSNNEIVLPAAVFTVPGMPEEELDDAFVYGYAGAATIGHEITHGFDNYGRKFDGAGNLKDWWSDEDAKGFQKRADVMVGQFNAIEPLPGFHINGQLSLGENLSDYGGLLLGLDAFKKTEQFRAGKSIGGFTPIQRFFLGYTYGWACHYREEFLRTTLLSDEHAPPHWRVNVPLSNIPEFHAAFGIMPGSPMWLAPESQVKVW